MRQTRVQYSGATLGGQAGHYPTPAVQGMSEGVVRKDFPSPFNRVPERVPEKVWEALVQSQVRFNRAPEKVPENQQGSGEGSGEGLGGFGAKPGQVQQGSEEVQKVWAWEALVQSQVQGSEEGSGEGLGLDGFGAEPGQVQQKVPEKVWVWVALVQSQVRTGCRRRSGRLWCRARSSSAGFAAV